MSRPFNDDALTGHKRERERERYPDVREAKRAATEHLKFTLVADGTVALRYSPRPPHSLHAPTR